MGNVKKKKTENVSMLEAHLRMLKMSPARSHARNVGLKALVVCSVMMITPHKIASEMIKSKKRNSQMQIEAKELSDSRIWLGLKNGTVD